MRLRIVMRRTIVESIPDLSADMPEAKEKSNASGLPRLFIPGSLSANQPNSILGVTARQYRRDILSGLL
jgi:hypothetical protein